MLGKKLYLQAMNIHQGGGQSLLLSLLDAIPLDLQVVALLDQRIANMVTLPSNIEVKFVKPALFNRLNAEWWLSKHVNASDCVLCFGNLPPLLPLKGYTMVFVQNRYLVDSVSLVGFSLKTKLRLMVERFWLNRCIRHANHFIVQTESMKRLFYLNNLPDESVVCIWPFASLESLPASVEVLAENNISSVINDRFIYVASGEPHKNHYHLIEAWIILAKEGLRPQLCITVDRLAYPKLCSYVNWAIDQYKLNVHNIGFLSHSVLLEIYQDYDVLIYPSLLESYGLPLIEARQQGLKIVASELDYVRDLVDPQETFDPTSAISIARSVKRYLGSESENRSIMSASEFLRCVINRWMTIKNKE